MIFPVNNRTATRCTLEIHYYMYHPFYLLQIFTFSIEIMFSLISSDANDASLSIKQTKLFANYQFASIQNEMGIK